MRYWDSSAWTEPGRADTFLATCREMAEAGTGTRLAVERSADGDFLGWRSLGYCYDDAVWGYGIATEAARALLEWGFSVLDLHRVQSEVDTRNPASARVLEKLGFQREGTLREDCVVDGEVSDSWVYGHLRREWTRTTSP
jgi:RimJ/RimL family protein N-acetyltransferase